VPIGRRIGGACASALVVTGIVVGCGTSRHERKTVARVEGYGITTADVAHWTKVLRGGNVSGLSSASEQRLRRQALRLLLSYYWLVGEASKRGVSITGFSLRKQIAHIENLEFPGGEQEIREFQVATGESPSDIELQAKAELASRALRRMAVATAMVTAAEVNAYYAQHKSEFLLPEQRIARFANPKSKVVAERIKRNVEAGKRSLTASAAQKVGEIFTSARVPPANEYERAIDSAKPHVVAGPFKLHADYWLYEVVKIIPARQQSLAEVEGGIRSKLTAVRRRHALEAFANSIRARWTPATKCEPGYVIPKCAEHARSGMEDPLTVL
jgi:hypothetical protein